MIATTLEQSRKLIELGINPDTADMHYAFTAGYYDEEYGYVDTLAEGESTSVLDAVYELIIELKEQGYL